MIKTPTLRVSADSLDLKASPPLPGPSPGVPESEVERWNRACALPSLWTSLRFGGVRTQPVTGAQNPEARVQALVASAFPIGRLGLRQGGAKDLVAAAPNPIQSPPWVAGRAVKPRLRPALTLDKPRIRGGVRTRPRGRAPPRGGGGGGGENLIKDLKRTANSLSRGTQRSCWFVSPCYQRPNPSWRLVPPPSACRINTKCKYQHVWGCVGV